MVHSVAQVSFYYHQCSCLTEILGGSQSRGVGGRGGNKQRRHIFSSLTGDPVLTFEIFRFVLQNIKIVPSFITIGGSGHRSYENIIRIFIFGLSGWQLTSLVPLVARIEQKWLLTSNDKGTNVRIRPSKMNAAPL